MPIAHSSDSADERAIVACVLLPECTAAPKKYSTNPVVLFFVVSHDAQLASVYVSMLSGIRLSCVCILGRKLCREYLVPLRYLIMCLSFLLPSCVGACSDLASSGAP